VAVVEDHDDEARLRQGLGVRRQAVVAGQGEPVRHDDAGRRIAGARTGRAGRAEEPRRAVPVAGGERDVLTPHRPQP
jgi:hypothetical protein